MGANIPHGLAGLPGGDNYLFLEFGSVSFCPSACFCVLSYVHCLSISFALALLVGCAFVAVCMCMLALLLLLLLLPLSVRLCCAALCLACSCVLLGCLGRFRDLF